MLQSGPSMAPAATCLTTTAGCTELRLDSTVGVEKSAGKTTMMSIVCNFAGLDTSVLGS